MENQPSSNNPQGWFMGLPYDFRKPTTDRVKERFWNQMRAGSSPRWCSVGAMRSIYTSWGGD